MKKIVCLIESKDEDWPNIPQSKIDGYGVQTTQMVKNGKKNYEKLIFIKD
jgi:hypothetical protein